MPAPILAARCKRASSDNQQHRACAAGKFQLERTGNKRARHALVRETAGGPMSNPKIEPTDNTEKDPDDWVSADEPMTGAQASYLKTLSEQAHRPDAFDEKLTKAEASKRIDE